MSEKTQGAVLPEDENRWALIVGADQALSAQDLRLHDKLHAVDDAEKIAEVLTGDHCRFKLFCPPLLGDNANSQDVRRAIRRFGEGRTDEDFLLLYFAGHGYVMEGGTYLVTTDFNEEEAIAQMHIAFSWLRDFFYFHTNARKVLLVLDCCYAGNIGQTTSTLSLEDLIDRLSQELKVAFDISDKTKNYQPNMLRQALTATVYGQTASEKNNHGVMTGYLLQALQGEVERVINLNDHGKVSLYNVYEYLLQAMPSPSQRPDLPGKPGGNECILAFYEERAEQLRRRKLTTVNEKPTTYIPWDGLTSFQQRPGEFDTVTKLLTEEQQAQPASAHRRVVGLIGIGGSGKTELALRLAYKYKDENRFPAGIFWLPVTGDDKQTLQQQLAALCADADYLPEGDDVTNPENERRRARHLCRWLAEHSDALLILDNVEQIDPLLRELLPSFAGQGLRCTIFYTSRRDDPPAYVRPYKVGALTEKGALSLLLEQRTKELALALAGDQSAESQAARSICDYVERLPLALTLLSDLLQDTDLTLTHLWEEQQQRGTIAITRFGQDILKAKLFTCFEQSWEKITLPTAQHVFKLAVHFPEVLPIQRWLLGLLANLKGHTRLESLGEACWELQRWGLIKVGDDGISLHSLIREFGRLLVQDDPQHSTWLTEANNRLLSAFTEIDHLRDRVLAQGYWSCLSDIQEALNYARLLSIPQLALLERIEYWMARESYLLGDITTWPKELPALFYQQFYNHFVEEGYPLPEEIETNNSWIRQLNRVGTGDQTLLGELWHPNEVTSVAFSPNNRSLLTACADDKARLWDVASGQLLRTFVGHSASVMRAVFSPDGQTIATCSLDETARLWDVASGREICVLRGHEKGIQSIAFSPDGTQVATASEDRTARVWNVADGQMVFYLAQHRGMLADVAFSPDGKQLVTCATDGNVLLWDIENEQVIATLLEDSDAQRSVAFSPDGTLVAMSSIDGVLLWDVARQRISRRFATTYTEQAYYITQVGFSPGGRYLAVSSGNGGSKNNMAQIWKIDTGELWCTFRQRDMISSVAFSPDGTKVATGSFDHTVRIWRFLSQPTTEPAAAYDGEIMSMQFSTDGRQLAVATNERAVRLWNVQSEEMGEGVLVPSLLPGNSAWAASIALSRDGKKVVIAMFGNVWIWDTERDGILAELATTGVIVRRQFNMASGIAISPNEQVIVTGSIDETARVWDLRKRQIVRTLQGHQGDITAIAFSPDGSKIVTSSTDSTALIWDARNYARKATLRGHIGPVACISIAPNSALVATGGLDGTIYLWSMRNGARLSTLKRHNQRVSCMSFSPDSSLLVSNDLLGQVLFWQAQQPSQPALHGLYTSTHEIGAIHWQDTRHLTLADTGGSENRPHFYHLALEGPW
jgi:WD40 repeat protein